MWQQPEPQPEPRAMPDRLMVEDAVAAEIQYADPSQKLSPAAFQDMLDGVARRVLDCMSDEGRTELNEEDRGFILRRVRKMVSDEIASQLRGRPSLRFVRFDRVLCNIGGKRKWAPGTVQSLNEEDPSDPTGQNVLPYVVKIDPPNGRLISVPCDEESHVRAEVCFGTRSNSLRFTLCCLPLRPDKARRFREGERVACAIEGADERSTIWAAGTVIDVDRCLESDASALIPERDWTGEGCKAPYRVQLDAGCKVLVHRDEHWLIRDLRFQPDGSRQVAGGRRCLARLKRRALADGQWEVVDHTTRKARACAPPESDDDEETD
uniref:Uncharacterized protein n=1 Tax=Coccolithus braarudii TaxID=221442 RepID=A0A7S0L8U5_9EUKA|mmetsp:Transcript_21624/g.46614  ORF Transcript_21624/g.46614 Transcript_21624/m.46614 type:complete len:322 (+) Transcript_21624:43-1008(+)